MKVETFEMGPVTMRTLSCDTKEAIAGVAAEHLAAGWRAGTLYPVGGNRGYVTLFKWKGEDKKPFHNHLKII